MKSIVMIILSILLAASVVSLAVLYNQHQDIKLALDDTKERCAELRVQLKQLEQSNRSMRQKIDTLEQNLHTAEEYAQSFKTESSAKDKMIAQLEREKQGIDDRLTNVISELEREKGKLESKYSSLITSYQSLVHDLEALKRFRELIPVLEEAILIKEQSLSTLTERLTKLQLRYEEEQRKTEELSAALSRKSGREHELRDELKRVQGELKRLETEIQGCREKTARLEDEIKSLKHQKAVAEEKTAQLQAKYTDLLANIEAFEKSRERMIELEQVVKQKNEQLAGLEANMGVFKDQIAQLHQTVSEGKKSLEGLKRRQTHLKQEKELREAQLGRLKTTYDALISGLKQEIANKEVTIETYQKKISVTFVDRILFDFAKASISTEGRSILRQVGDILKKVKDRTIRVVGHTDDVPISSELQRKYPSNWELSTARAAAVVRYLQREIGLDPENMEAVGRAFYAPVADNETEVGRAQNRRVNIIIGPAVHAPGISDQ